MAKVRVQDATKELSTNTGKMLESITQMRKKTQEMMSSLRKISGGFAREAQEVREREAREEQRRQYEQNAQFMTAYSSEQVPEVPVEAPQPPKAAPAAEKAEPAPAPAAKAEVKADAQPEAKPAPQNPQPQRPYGRPVQGAQGQNPQGGQRPYGRPVQGQNPQGGQRPYGRPVQGQNPQGGQRPYGRPAQGAQQGGERRPYGGGAGGSRQGGYGRSKLPDLVPAVEKERVSNYDPNKKQYVRQVDPERNASKNARRRDTGMNVNINNYDDEFMRGKKKKKQGGAAAKTAIEPTRIEKAVMTAETITVRDLSERIGKPAGEIIKKLMMLGIIANINNELDYDTAGLVCAEYNIELEKKLAETAEDALEKEDVEDADEDLQPRPPVVTIMGHVDHGKTSLLDYIRKTKVTAGEAGGITQHIGAYTVNLNGKQITFLDTPGHEAFTSMRLRGAQSTDIAVLVVAADDGVMPQTVEAINHAKAAGVEIIVAVNKIDKPDANPDKVKEQLSKYELIPSEWGGQTEFVPVSAKTGEGIDELLDTILLQADVMELKANPDRLARGLVLEAKLDRGRGPVANVLVQKGTLHVGDFISAGPAFGKVRAMINDKGKNVKEAGPSDPVVVLGLSDVPGAGEVIVAHPNNDEAKSYAQTYKAQHKEELVEENVMSMNVEDLFDQMREGKMKELELIVKADVQGSVEALCGSLQKLSNDEVKVRIIHSAAGNITESDVDLAAASNAAIIGFNVHPDSTAKSIAEHNGVSIHLYKVIYQAIDDVNAALNGMLAPVYEEKVIGHAEVRQLFKSGKIGNIAGSMVLDGLIEKGCTVRITRDGEKIFEGGLASLKRFKDDVKEVKAGYDCGLVFDDFDAMNVGDQIEAYKMVEVPREEVIARKEKEAARKAKEKA